VFLVVSQALIIRAFGYRMPRIVQDLAQGAIFIGVALLSLQSAGVNPTSLLATSAVLTAVLGLSLQETLGNLFAGLAIQGEQPFEVGDWVQFDQFPERAGRVVEINWRATKLETADRVLITVPNGVLARAPIANFSRPQPFTRRHVVVDTPFGAPAGLAEIFEKAAVQADGVLTSPPPSAVIQEVTDFSVRYRIRFFISDHPRQAEVTGLVLKNVLHALERLGLEIPMQRRRVEWQKTVRVDDEESAPQVARRRVIDRIDLLRVLSEEARNEIAAMSKVWRYARGESVVREGETGHELFIVVSGTVRVQIQQRGAAVEVARLGPGEFFGEMSLLTGEPRAATIVALEETEVVVVEHGAFQRAIEQDPTVLSQISQELARRQAELSARLASGGSVYPAETAPLILARIRRFFGVPQ
jgi:small-conductance mechanosensitive channel/CRP-like cAMP-binding protein